MADSMRRRFVKVTSERLDENPRLAVVLADITTDRFMMTGAYQRHPNRVINVGIREQLMVNVAAGMALEGMRAIAHSFAPFLVERSYEQVKLAFAHQNVGGILVSYGAPYDVAAYGRTHQTAADVALMATLPGWRIHLPGHPDEAEAMLRDAITSDDAVYIRLTDQQNAEPLPVARGRLTTVRRGSNAAPTIVAIGPMLDPVVHATVGLDATILYVSTVKPFDAEGLRIAATGSDFVLVEPSLEGTSVGAITTALSDRPRRLLSIGVPDIEHRKYGTAAQHNQAHGLDAAGIRSRIAEWVGAAASADLTVRSARVQGAERTAPRACASHHLRG
jgi:transketolase